MESSSMAHPHGRNYDEGTHNTGLHAVIEGEDENHHEKKSVIKKVKAKAKKIKDKLTHGHEHEEEEDNDHEEEDMVQDPEVHGAPMYESTAARSAVSRVGLGQSAGGDYLESPSVKEENRHDDSHIFDPPVRPFSQWQAKSSGLDKPTAVAVTDKRVSFNPAGDVVGRDRDLNPDRSTVKIGELTGIEEDPHAPKHQPRATAPSNYESKVTDPTGGGGKEAGITSTLHSLDKMGIYDESKPKPKQELETKQYTGSHDQFTPESVPKSFNPDKPEELPLDTLSGNPSNQSSYTEKISSATSALAGKAVAAKDAIASKLGYTGSQDETSKSALPTENAHKIAATMTEKLAPVYDKVAVAGSTVMSKVQGTGTGTGQQTMEKGADKGVSVTSYLTERLRPGDEDKALSEVITHAFHRGKEEKGKAEEEKLGQGQDRPISEVVSDALHKREPKKGVEEGKAMGKVTESEEVRRRLGTGEEQKHSGGEAGNVSVEKGVVDRLKGAVISSWIGKGSESQGTGTTYVTDEGLATSSGAEERKRGEENAQQQGRGSLKRPVTDMKCA